MSLHKRNKLVCGVGTNDADYPIYPTVNGKQVMCPYYRAWRDALTRCYSAVEQARYPTYIGCSVCDEWLIFSNFKRWMEQEDWQGKELDKDLLFPGNKVYSPETCVFIDHVTNSFTTDSGAARGEWPVGVYFSKRDKKFLSQCRNPFTGKREHLGLFTCADQAHLAWLARKHQLACQLADLQTDSRVANALRTRYLQPMGVAA